MRLLELIHKETGVQVSGRSRLDELGFDSLELLELQQKIESDFNIRIPDEDFTKAETIADLGIIVDRQLSA